MYLKTQGLVIRVCPYNDTDAMLTVLTGEYGKISAKVRGLRRKNSPLSAPCQLLSLAEFTLFEYKNAYTVNEAHCVELFTEIRKDIQLFSLGTYFVQVAEVISQEDLPNPHLLSLTLNCLYALSKLNLPEEQVKAIFEWRSASLAGYMPDLSGCHCCGDPNADLFNINHGHLECSHCRSLMPDGIRMPVTVGLLEAMRYICTCDHQRLFAFTLPQASMQQLSHITEAYLCTQLERGFSTLDFYKSLLFNPI